jgi:hypothetical protein
MRFYEIDLGGARSVLDILQDLADKEGRTSELPFSLVQQAFADFDFAIGNGGTQSQQALQALFKDIDPEGEIVADVTPDATVILKTQTPSSQVDTGVKQATGQSVDRMASHNAKSAFK